MTEQEDIYDKMFKTMTEGMQGEMNLTRRAEDQRQLGALFDMARSQIGILRKPAIFSQQSSEGDGRGHELQITADGRNTVRIMVISEDPTTGGKRGEELYLHRWNDHEVHSIAVELRGREFARDLKPSGRSGVYASIHRGEVGRFSLIPGWSFVTDEGDQPKSIAETYIGSVSLEDLEPFDQEQTSTRFTEYMQALPPTSRLRSTVRQLREEVGTLVGPRLGKHLLPRPYRSQSPKRPR